MHANVSREIESLIREIETTKRNQVAIPKINDIISEIKNLLHGLKLIAEWTWERKVPMNLEIDQSKLSNVNNKEKKNT